MHTSQLLLTLLPLVSACVKPSSEPCASALSVSAAAAATFCATYTKATNTATTGLPAFASACSNLPKKLSSACSCLSAPTTLKTSTKTSVAASTTIVKATTTTAKASVPTTTSKGATTTAAVTKAPTGSACTASLYAQITSVVASCTDIVLENISAPASSTILLNKLKQGTKVTFVGKTTFGTTPDDDFDPIVISGTDITITGAPGHVIDGNGQAYWDGQGSNGGSHKPDHFIVVSKVVNGHISNLNIQNYPVHCFDVTGADGITLDNIHLDNSAGNAPNSASGSLPAAHNSDGFDFSSSNNVILSNSYVTNQDDCVAVTSGNNVTITGMTCIGGHGLSIGSVGGKSNNVVTDITFSHSVLIPG